MKRKKISEKQQKLDRFLWADILRIIAIYFVVHFHTAFTPLDKISVPLFVMVSGALLLDKQEKTILFFKKRTQKVLIPWLIWAIIYMIYFLYFGPDQVKTIKEYFDGNFAKASFMQWAHYFLVVFFSSLWFLPMIFSLYLLTPFLRIVMRYGDLLEKYFLIGIWFIFFSLLPFIFDNSLFPKYQPNIVFTALQYSGYFILGSLIVKTKANKNIVLVTLVLFFSSLLLIRPESSFVDPATFFASLSFFYLIFCLSERIDTFIHPKIRKSIVLLSAASFGIYLIHGLIVGIFGVKLNVFLNAYSLGFLVPFLLFVCSALIVIILQKIPFLKRIVP